MKNRKKALIIAMICLAAAAVLYLLVVKMNQKEANSESDDSDDSLVISSVDSGQITAISYEKDGKTVLYKGRTAPGMMLRIKNSRSIRTV